VASFKGQSLFHFLQSFHLIIQQQVYILHRNFKQMQAAPGYFLVGEGRVSVTEAGGQVIERGIHFSVKGFGAVEV